MQTVLLTGGTGLVGKAFTQLLTSKGYQVIILSRGKKEIVTEPNVTYAQWNVATEEIDIEAVKKADYIIHLAGENRPRDVSDFIKVNVESDIILLPL